MWNVTPDQPLGCDGCGRQIAPGEPYISDLPQHLPKNVNRRDYRHFHLESPHHNQADATPSSSCYREFATQRVSEQAKEELVCLGCGHLILDGEEYLQEFLFVRDDGKSADDFESEPGPAALVASLLRSRQVKPGSFAGLSSQTVRKFQRAGLSNGRGIRSHTATQEFYRTSIPGPVRNLGEEAVKRFTQGKEASHIRSVANAPGQARNPANIVWESAKANAKRRSRNMTPKQVVEAKAVNAADTFKIVGRAAGKNAGKGAVFAALFEFPVSLVENGISICRGKKSRREAAKDTGKDVATAGVVGGVMAAGTTAAVALGAGPALTASLPVMVPVGVGIFAVSASSRIWRAWKDGLKRLELHFHAACPACEAGPNCYKIFADWVSSYYVEEIGAEGPESVR